MKTLSLVKNLAIIEEKVHFNLQKVEVISKEL